MTNIFDVKTNVFDPKGVIAELYDASKNIPHLIGKTFIKPFHTEMKKDVNNIILFLNEENNIIGGHVGKYNNKKGIYCVSFVM